MYTIAADRNYFYMLVVAKLCDKQVDLFLKLDAICTQSV